MNWLETERGRSVGAALHLVIVVLCILYLLSPAANAGANEGPATERQTAYVKALEKTLAACLSDATGRVVQFDGKTYLCGIVEVF